jgi:hypothetical protein
MRGALRAQDQRIAAEMRLSPWRAPQSRQHWNRQQSRPYGYGYTDNLSNSRYNDNQQTSRYTDPQTTPGPVSNPQDVNNPTQSREFNHYLATGLKKLEITSSKPPDPRTGSGAIIGKPREWNGQRPAWNSNNRVLGPRRENLRVDPKRPCWYCGGYHYDSMCKQRTANTPRVTFAYAEDDTMIYSVEPTGDDEYDE